MTDFNKVKHYYSHFDEKNRLRNDNSGKLEFLMTMQILEKYLPAVDTVEKAGADAGAGKTISILDLGGGVCVAVAGSLHPADGCICVRSLDSLVPICENIHIIIVESIRIKIVETCHREHFRVGSEGCAHIAVRTFHRDRK